MPTELPIVDLKSIAEDEAISLGTIDHACRCFNAFLVATSLPRDLFLNMKKSAALFFGLPKEEKLSLHRPGSGLGYLPEGAENLAATIGIAAPPDPKETF